MAKKRIADRDLGIGCDFIAEGSTNAEVIRKATLHIKDDHPGEFPRVKDKIRNFIKSEHS